MLWILVCVYVYSICLLYSILQTKVCILHIIVLSSSLLCALRCAIYYIFITFHIHGVWIELTTDEISFQISLHFKIQFNWEKIDWKEVNLLTEFFLKLNFSTHDTSWELFYPQSSLYKMFHDFYITSRW